MSRRDLQGFLLRTSQNNCGEYIEVPKFQDLGFRACGLQTDDAKDIHQGFVNIGGPYKTARKQ